MTSDLILQSSAAALYCKVLVDIWRYYNRSAQHDIPGWFYAILSVIIGVLVSTLLSISQQIEMTPSTLASCVLTGIIAAAQAIGVTELQKRG